jgi:hypothetical protein
MKGRKPSPSEFQVVVPHTATATNHACDCLALRSLWETVHERERTLV